MTNARTDAPGISLIVPVYNVEAYLHRCLDSVLAQKFTDFEAILVDDGSTDASGRICDEYAEKDARFRVIHKQNGGVSSARNMGIQASGGGYIAFLDSDDAVGEGYLASLVGGPADADLVVGGYRMLEQESGETVYACRIPGPETLERGYDGIKRLFALKSFVFPFAKRFSRELLLRHGIAFPEKVSLGEDAIFMAQYIGVCQKICLTPQNEYLYYKYTAERRLTSDPRFYDADTYFNRGQLVYNDAMRKAANDARIERDLWEGHWLGVQYKITDLFGEDAFSAREKRRLLDRFVKHEMFGTILENLEKTAEGKPDRFVRVCKTRNGRIIYLYLKAVGFKNAVMRRRKS